MEKEEKLPVEAKTDTKTVAKTEAKAKLAKLKAEGFHNCTRVKLIKNTQGVISEIGGVVNKIKAMHESNIDEYNSQQVNSLMLIKKDGAKYELVDVNVPGRKNALKMFMEVKK